MTVKQMTNRAALLALGGMLVLSTGGGVLAFDSQTETLKDMDTIHGFDPAGVIAAAAMSPTLTPTGPCFQCPNGGDAGGTTAGALTDRLFGGIRLNSAPNTGFEGRNPSLQGQTIPSSIANNSGAFVVSTPSAGQDFLSAGTVVASSPTTDLDGNALGTVGKAGVRLSFSNEFTFDGTAGTSSFTQSVDQATFTGGLDDNAVQLVRFNANGATTTGSTSTGDNGFLTTDINLEQTIVEGGFLLGGTQLLTGDPLDPLAHVTSFPYNEGSFDSVDAPTGLGQAAGTTNLIGN